MEFVISFKAKINTAHEARLVKDEIDNWLRKNDMPICVAEVKEVQVMPEEVANPRLRELIEDSIRGKGLQWAHDWERMIKHHGLSGFIFSDVAFREKAILAMAAKNSEVEAAFREITEERANIVSASDLVTFEHDGQTYVINGK